MLTFLILAATFAVAGAHENHGTYSSSEYCSLKPSESRHMLYNSTAPFVISPDGMKDSKWCYQGGMTIPVIIGVNDIVNEFYTGFFMQARAKGSSSSQAYGEFSAMTDFPDVRIESCGSGTDNTVMNSKDGKFYAHKVYWTAPSDFWQDIVFKVTFMNTERGWYWYKEIMFPLKYESSCEGSVPKPVPVDAPRPIAGNVVVYLMATILVLVNIM